MEKPAVISSVEEVRCKAPHPTISGWTCRAKLADVAPGRIVVRREHDKVPSGGVVIACGRCKTRWLLHPATPEQKAA